MSTFDRDRNLIRARQELAQAQSLVCSAINKTARDARAKGVRFDAARDAVDLAIDDLAAVLGHPRHPVESTLFSSRDTPVSSTETTESEER